jgi:hypothetical protein
MFMWNSLVAFHTFTQFSEAKQIEIIAHYGQILSLNNVDPMLDIAAGTPLDPFWLSIALGDLGVPPMLGPRTAKWFYVTNPRRARSLMNAAQASDLAGKVIVDVHEEYGIVLNVPE